MAAEQLQISAEEAAMNGAPEGVLYVAKILERDEVPIPNEGGLEEMFEQLHSQTALGEWWEKFTFADKVRSVIIHYGESLTPKASKELIHELCVMGGSSRSVLAHQALVTLGDLFHFCPGATAAAGSSALGAVADIFFDSAKKNKARVLRDRAATVLGEVTDSYGSNGGEDGAMTALVMELLAPALAKKHVGHLDLKVMEQTMLFAERASERFVERGLLAEGGEMDGKALGALLAGLGAGCVSKSADAKSAAKRAVCVVRAGCAPAGNGGRGEGAEDFKAFIGQVAGCVVPSSALSELLKVPFKAPKDAPGAAAAKRNEAREAALKAAVAAKEEAAAAAAEGGGETITVNDEAPPTRPTRDFTRDPKPPPPPGDGGGIGGFGSRGQKNTLSALQSNSDFNPPPTPPKAVDASDYGRSSSKMSSRSVGSSGSGGVLNCLGLALHEQSVWCLLAAHLHATKGRASELFSAMDKDRSRKVTKAEVSAFLKGLGLRHSLEDLDEAFASAGGVAGSSASTPTSRAGSRNSAGPSSSAKEGFGLTLTQVKAEVARYAKELAQNPDALAAHLANLKASSGSSNRRSTPQRSPPRPSRTSNSVTSKSSPASPASPPRPSNSSTSKTASPHSPPATSTLRHKSAPKSATPSPHKSRTPPSPPSPPSPTSPSSASPPAATHAATRNSSISSALSKATDGATRTTSVTSSSTVSSKATVMDDLASMSLDEISYLDPLGGGGWDTGGSGGAGGGRRKASGVVLAFDAAGEGVAASLHSTLCDMGVEVKPLMKGESRPYLEEHKEELAGAALLVVLKTATYGKEPKHQAEVGALVAAAAASDSPTPAHPPTPVLLVNLCTHFSLSGGPAVLDKLLAGSPALAPECVYSAPVTWDPSEALTTGKLPVDLSAHVVNFMIASSSKTASYNVDDSTKYAATSSAEPRRASLVLESFVGGDAENDEERRIPGADEDGNGDNGEKEAAFLRFQQEGGDDGDEEAAFMRFRQERSTS